MKKGYLVLANGVVFEGMRFGDMKSAVGELVLNTSVVGYIKTLTDECYHGQIVMQTFPLIGNYGIISDEFDTGAGPLGYIVGECCDAPSNFRCEYDLDTFLKERGIPGLMGVDTRDVTRILRTEGVMNAMICDSVPDDLTEITSYSVNNALSAIKDSGKATYGEAGGHRVAMINLGKYKDAAEALAAKGCSVDVLPHTVSASDVLAGGYDGVVISCGAGDPNEYTDLVALAAALKGNIPLLGLGLGHQLLALAMGASVTKMKFGHRGSNLPVKDIVTGRTYITGQNHGYTVNADSVPDIGSIRWVNANDALCEGIEYPSINALSVQFDVTGETEYVYDRFLALMEG